METLVSVIMPTYKRTFSFISKSIESVLKQSYSNLELILIDDNPKESIKEYNIEENIKKLNDNRIRYIQHGDNKGACAARNTGIMNSKGEYIAFLDDDDEWLLSKTYKQLEKLKNSSSGLVYSPYYVCHNGEKTIRKTIKSGWVYKDLLYTNFIGSTSCVMMKKKCILDVGLFEEELPASQDYELYLRISEKFLIDVVEEPLLNYYDHEGERISGDPYKKMKAREYIYENYKDSIKKHPKINREKHLLLAHSYMLNNKKKLKWKHWFASLITYPVPSLLFLNYTYRIWFNYK